MLLALPVLLPLLGGVAVFFQKEEKRRNHLAVATVLATALCAVLVCLLPERSLEVLTIDQGLTVAFRSDTVSRLFLLLDCGIWTAAVFFAFPYLRHAGRQSQFLGFFLVTLGILAGLALADSFITLYLFFELMTLLTVPLVIHDGTEGSRRAGVKYMGYSVFGAGLALAGFFLVFPCLASTGFTAGGALDPGAVEEHRTLLLTAYGLMFVGFGCKAGLLPMQSWLTAAHPVAPAPASAVLSGIITKGGVLAILRATYYLFGPELIRGTELQLALLVLTLLTIFVGSMLAFKEQLLKKRLAYSTVSQVSYVLFGILLLSGDGLRGALLQVVFHAVAKDALFLAAGAIIVATSCTRVEQLVGIGKRMPVTTWCFALASLSLVGIPPLCGFVSKWYLAVGALEDYGALGIWGAAILLLSALLTAGYLLPIVTRGFFPGQDYIAERREVGRSMLVPMLVLAALTLVLGLFPGGVLRWVDSLLPALL